MSLVDMCRANQRPPVLDGVGAMEGEGDEGTGCSVLDLRETEKVSRVRW